ncbi:AAA family ATPase [Salmonella enterica subsp. enterica serovar Cerro]
MKRLIPAGALCSIYGPGGSFKSFLAVSLACHIASGTSWGGRRVNQGAVLFIAGEGGTGVSRRIRAWDSALMTRWRSITCFASTARSFQPLREASNR